METQKRTFIIDKNSIEADIEPYSLKKALKIEVEKKGKIFSFYNEDLNITSIGYSKSESRENFIKFLKDDYLSYMSTPDAKLSNGAKKVKLKYRSYIKAL